MVNKNPKYGLARAHLKHPMIDLYRVPHKGRSILVSPLFGARAYDKNVKVMGRKYSHSMQLPEFSFRPATTSESISAYSYLLGDAYSARDVDIDLGIVVACEEGIFVNPPIGEDGKPICDEDTLKKHLKNAKKQGLLYLVENKKGLRDFGFAPYHDSIGEGTYVGFGNLNKFTRSPLARALEHTDSSVAEKFRELGHKIPGGYFNWENSLHTEIPTLQVVKLFTHWVSSNAPHVISLSFQDCDDDLNEGYAFGVVEKKK